MRGGSNGQCLPDPTEGGNGALLCCVGTSNYSTKTTSSADVESSSYGGRRLQRGADAERMTRDGPTDGGGPALFDHSGLPIQMVSPEDMDNENQ